MIEVSVDQPETTKTGSVVCDLPAAFVKGSTVRRPVVCGYRGCLSTVDAMSTKNAFGNCSARAAAGRPFNVGMF